MMKGEIYRIISRKISLAAMILPMMVAFLYMILSSVWEEAVIDQGEVYQRLAAIGKDKEIAAEYTGVLTENVVRDIWEKYGAPVNYLERNTGYAYLQGAAMTGGNDNYTNRLVAKLFAQETLGEDGGNTFILPQNLSDNIYLRGDFLFGYAGSGWGYYWDRFLVLSIVVGVVIVVCLSPGFAEDYTQRMADIILSAAKGREKCFFTRILAGGLFATSYYWLVMGILLLETFWFYGTEGLGVSCGLTGMPMTWSQGQEPLWKALVMLHLSGWFAITLLSAMVQAISAKCRNTFSAILWSLAIYFGPNVFCLLILDQLPMLPVNLWLHQIIYSMPFTYSGMVLNAPGPLRYILTAFACIFLVISLVWGKRGWCRHQVTN